MNGPIFLDYNATTPIDPRVRDAMLPYLGEVFGNPSSSHAYGRAAHQAVECARAQVASMIGAEPDEIVFTGGGSEADTQAIVGAALAGRKRHIVSQATEHPAVINAINYLVKRFGFRATLVPVDGTGRVDLGVVARALETDTGLVSIMHANNETGTVQPISVIAKLCRARGILVHSDAAQSMGKIPVNVDDLGVDLLTIASHKVYGPKGVGALYVRRGVAIDPIIHGAGHEQGRRAGTENVAGIVGLAKACEIAAGGLSEEMARLQSIRDRLQVGLRVSAPTRLNGHPTERLPNTLNLSFLGQVGDELLAKCPDLAASTGSACHSGKTEPSSVLLAMGIAPNDALGAVRLSLGRWTTTDDVDRASSMLLAALRA